MFNLFKNYHHSIRSKYKQKLLFFLLYGIYEKNSSAMENKDYMRIKAISYQNVLAYKRIEKKKLLH